MKDLPIAASNDTPFEGQRMIIGGFAPMVSLMNFSIMPITMLCCQMTGPNPGCPLRKLAASADLDAPQRASRSRTPERTL